MKLAFWAKADQTQQSQSLATSAPAEDDLHEMDIPNAACVFPKTYRPPEYPAWNLIPRGF